MPQFHLRFVFRSFQKNPLVVGAAVLSLALGIGANTAIFSLIDQLLLRTLPVENPRELVQLAARGSHYGSNYGMNAMSYPMYEDFRDKSEVFQDVISRRSATIGLGYGGDTERVRGEMVSGNYFDMLGVGAALGRTITPGDDRLPGEHPVAILSYDFWTSRFGSDPSILGDTVYLNNYPMTVIGVSQQNFQGVEVGEATQVFVPLMMYKQMLPVMSNYYTMEDRRSRWVNVFARLEPGVSIAEAEVSIEPLFGQILRMELEEEAFANASQYSKDRFLESRMTVFDGATGRSFLRGQFRTPLYVLLGLTGLVLLIACANVANLLITRASARGKEIAVRFALGASRSQVWSQLMIESLVISVAAAALGIWLGVGMVRFLLTFFAAETSQLMITGDLDVRVLGFSLGVALLTALLAGFAPALQAARASISGTLTEGAASVIGGGRGARLRKGLVVGQVGLSLLLLVTSGLFVRTLANLRSLDPGFEVKQLVSFEVDPYLSGYDDPKTRDFYGRLQERLKALPGVESTGYSIIRILDGSEWDSSVTVQGYERAEGENMNPHFNAVSPDYFQTLGIHFLAGRDFDRNDVLGAPKVTIVNETFARRYFPDGDAVGRRMGQGGDPDTELDLEIVGVVADSMYEDMRQEIPRQVFLPFGQLSNASGVVIYTRTTTNASAFFQSVRSSARKLDANIPVYGMRTLDEQVNRSLTTERMVASLSGAFGVLATILAIIGLYGVMSFSVARRAQEIAIRMAFGAPAWNVVRMVVREVGTLVVLGVGIAIPSYYALSSLIGSQLYGISSGDTGTLGGAVILLTVVALLAGLLPALRAARLDPMLVLRYE